MKVNLIDCCKPKRRFNPNFTGNSEESTPKILVEHYKTMPDDVLERLSLVKAQAQVDKSIKMQTLKALPLSAMTAITTSFALSQPGKLSAKAASGLGFLALVGISTKLSNYINKKNEGKSNKEAALRNLATIGGIFVGAAALAKGKDLVGKALPNVDKFAKTEVSKLANEIDTSKFGKFFNKTVNPFLEQKPIKLGLAISPIATILSALFAGNKLAKGIKNDFKQKAIENYTQDKLANKEYVKIGLPASVFEG